MEEKDLKTTDNNINRRDLLKAMATVPLVGALGYGLYKKHKHYSSLNNALLEELNIGDIEIPEITPDNNKKIRIGVVGLGGRASYLVRSLGFVHPREIDGIIKKAKKDKNWQARLDNFKQQENLNVEITAICDIFDIRAEDGLKVGANLYRNGSNGKMAKAPKRYKTYKELCAAPDVDAVIIGTPDHWHSTIAIEAAKNGKHVYCEKPLSWTVAETYEVRKVVKDKGIVFQLGHQGRQTDSYNAARALIKKGALGKVNLIEVCTNRNSPNGAWVYNIHPKANEKNIDWKQFIGPAPWHDFSLERFFRWRCWWDYGTGLSGDLFTHEFDAMNQIFDLGIPDSAMASGGIYYFKDGRTVPDVLNQVYEYKDQELSLLYSASLASERPRGKVIMGHDASMELGSSVTVKVDPRSTKYAEKIRKGVIQPNKPAFSYVPGRSGIDAVTTATEKYFANRGLLYTYRNGKQIDTTHLHLKEWINCIRKNDGTQPSCNIDAAFEEAMAAHMGTISYREGRRTYWDKEKEVIV
jgi:predicted dehydrogenase